MDWKNVVKWGLILGVLVVIWQAVMGYTGWYADPVMANVFLVVVLMDIVVVILALRATRATQGYGAQVASGVMVGVVASVLIFGGSVLFTAVLFPDYFESVAAMQETVLVQQGMAADVASAIAERTRNTTHVAAGLQGVLGTVVTSLIVALLAAIGFRKKKDAVVDEKWAG